MDELKWSPYLRLIQRTGSTKHAGGFRYTDFLLSRTNLTEASRVLDVGCGAGHTSAHIAKTYGCHVTGVDIAPEAIERAQAIYCDEPYFDRMSFHVGDATDLSRLPQDFHVVLCESVLIFIKDKARALSQMASRLRPGGFLAINELCAGEGEHEQEAINFFARPEMGGFLTTSETLVAWFGDGWRLVVVDEQPFDMKAQAQADWAQWGNFRGLTQLLETGYQLVFNKHMQSDLLAVLKYFINAPPGIFKHLNLILILAQKNTECRTAA